jgi:hypothetical protein
MSNKSYLVRREHLKSEECEREQLSYEVEQAHLQFQADLLATRYSLPTARNKLETAKGANPYSTQLILKAMDEVESLERGIEALNLLKEELFPENN